MEGEWHRVCPGMCSAGMGDPPVLKGINCLSSGLGRIQDASSPVSTSLCGEDAEAVRGVSAAGDWGSGPQAYSAEEGGISLPRLWKLRRKQAPLSSPPLLSVAITYFPLSATLNLIEIYFIVVGRHSVFSYPVIIS